MAGHQTHALLRRGKRVVAQYIKAECNRPTGQQQLSELLDHLLDPSKALDDFDTIDWCKWLISGGTTFDEFVKTVRLYDNATTCGLVWTANFVAYRCRTCGISPCMSLCSDCFQAGNHTGHDFNMFRSQAGGACDCGDVNVMNSAGFCPRHGPDHSHADVTAPPDLLAVSVAMMPKLFVRLIHHLRNNSRPEMLDTYLIAMQDADLFLTFLHNLSDMGKAMKTVMTEALTNPQLYKNFTQETAAAGNLYLHHSQANYLAAIETLKAPPCPQLCSNLSGLSKHLVHESLLEELVFWTVKFEFPQKIVTLLLGLLPDENFKAAFIKGFVQHYTRISVALVNSVDRQTIANKVVHISVQLFSNEKYAVKMTEESHLLHLIIISLEYMITNIVTSSEMQDPENNLHVVADCASDVMRDHCYWPIVSDLINLLSHRSLAHKLMESEQLLSMWFELISHFQGINLNQRELTQHVEYESDTYYAAFSAELEICASPMWSMVSHVKDAVDGSYTRLVLKMALEELESWFDAINIRQMEASGIHHGCEPNPCQVSFHLPLHRYYSVFLSNAVRQQDMVLDDLLPGSESLKLIMIHPLQIQIATSEIFANMWVRNGLQIKGQAMTYIQCHFCNSLVDADVYLLQICASRLPPSYFLNTVIDRFHIRDWLTLSPVHTNPYLLPEKETPLVEGMLTCLTYILSIRLHLGLSSKEITHKEMVSLLCVADRTHSKLMDLMPEKCGLTAQTKDFEDILKEVAEYKPPALEAGGNLQQGMYVPKGHVWVDHFDPVFVWLRAVHRRDFQAAMDRYTEYVRQAGVYNEKGTPWPPFRLPEKIMLQYKTLNNVLHSRLFHGMLFTILYKYLHEPVISEAIVYLSVYLLELAVTTAQDGVEAGEEAEQQADSPQPHVPDKYFEDWFPSNNTITNLTHTVTKVAMETAEIDLSVMASESLDIEMEDLAAHAKLPGPDNFDAVVPADKHDERDMSMSDGPKQKPKTSTTIIDVNECLISLLIKLHHKISGRLGSYIPRSRRTEETNPGKESRVGDGAHFVGLLLDKISKLSAETEQKIDEVCYNLQPKKSKGTAKKGVDMEERRRRNRERQAKLMADFASKQKAFMEQAMEMEDDNLDGEGDNLDGTQDEEVLKSTVQEFDCVICRQNTPSTMERPVGLVALLQATSVLGHRRAVPGRIVLPTSDSDALPPDTLTCAKAYDARLKMLQEHFEDASSVLSVNVGWEGGVHAQTCGHYLHMDCCTSYVASLKRQDHRNLAHSLNVQKGEYWCPLCRQLANTILPILPDVGDIAVSRPVPSNLRDKAVVMAEIMSTRPVTSGSSVIAKAMGTVMEHLTNATYPSFKNYAKTQSSENVLLFVCSVARCNLELDLLLYGGKLFNRKVVSRKSTFLPLFHVLGLHSKILTTTPYTEIWEQLTGLSAMKQNIDSVSLYQKEVPILLKDVISLMIQLVLTMPPELEKEYFQCFVHSLFNLCYVQALSVISCRFPKEERLSWKEKGMADSMSSLPGLLSVVITHLSLSSLYDHIDSTTQMPAICQSVWSPNTVESAVEELCLPILRIAAVLQCHMYGEELPEIKTEVHEYSTLAHFLGFNVPDSRTPNLTWVTDNPRGLVRGWCRSFCDFVNIKTQAARSLLLMLPSWYSPRLLSLPREYDRIFQYYRKRHCRTCTQIPKEPAICLICGRFLCFKDACCKQQHYHECVQHSINCGAGTGIILVVNSSVVVVIRGDRATLWGSVYLDEHGEEDRELKRGRPLYLSEERYSVLEQQWLSHSFSHTCKRWIWHRDVL